MTMLQKSRRLDVFFLSLVALALLSLWMALPAFAQTPVPVPAPLTVLNTSGLVILILSLLAGYVSHSIQTGSFLGMVTIPKTWLPWVTLGGTFLVAFVASLAANGGGGVTELALVNAALAGFLALGANTIGATAKQQIAAHLRDMTPVAPAAPKGGQAGFSVLGVLGLIVIVGILALIVAAPRERVVRVETPDTISTAEVVDTVQIVESPVALEGCSSGSVVPSANTQAVIDDSAALALCVETVIQHDETETPPAADTQVLIDEGVTCGPEAAALVNAIGQETNSSTMAAAIEHVHADVKAKRALAAKKGH